MSKYAANYLGLVIRNLIPRKRKTKAQMSNEILAHNVSMIISANGYVKEMRNEPSVLEQKMQTFLSSKNIRYEFQKALYIKDYRNKIDRYYIVDFFIPDKNIIIETDGRFHDNQIEYDNRRTIDIQRYCGDYRIIRWRWHDFNSLSKMKALVSLLK